MNWQPIETAPKDGTPVLILVEGKITQAYYDSAFLEADGKRVYFWERWEPAWFEYHGCGCCSGDPVKPSHWMPLPAPPLTEVAPSD